MLAGGITVPAYTTYTEKDYEFIIDDCQPSILVVSSNDLFKKSLFLRKRGWSTQRYRPFLLTKDLPIHIANLPQPLKEMYWKQH